MAPEQLAERRQPNVSIGSQALRVDCPLPTYTGRSQTIALLDLGNQQIGLPANNARNRGMGTKAVPRALSGFRHGLKRMGFEANRQRGWNWIVA